MKIRSRLTLILPLAIVFSAHASETQSELVKLSFKSPKAFECAMLSEDESEQNRFIDTGIDSGRAFLTLRKDHPQDFDAVRSKIPLIWLVAIQPSKASDDFVLGQVFSAMANALRAEASESKAGSFSKSESFTAKGCQLI